MKGTNNELQNTTVISGVRDSPLVISGVRGSPLVISRVRGSPLVISGVRGAQSLVNCVVFCSSLFVPFISQLYCLLLLTASDHVASSNLSCH
jgi:hypothetical protein